MHSGAPTCWYFWDALSALCVFLSPQHWGIWAAPLMAAFVAGSETKTETYTGRQRPIRQVIEGPVPTICLIFINMCVAALLTHTYANAYHPSHLSGSVLFSSTAAKRWKWVKAGGLLFLQIRAFISIAMQMRCGLHVVLVIPATPVNGNTTLFFLGLAPGENLVNYVEGTERRRCED